MSEHTLTEHERRLLEDCPREKLDNALVEEVTTVDIAKREDGSFYVQGWASRRTGAYIPRAAVEAWLAEQDEHEAEIERRIGGAIAIKSERLYFDDWESTTDVFFVSATCRLYRHRRAAPSTAIPVPRERIRAALDAKRAADHIGEPNELTKAKEADMQESDGPWRIVQNEEYFDVTKDPADQDAWFATFDIERYGRAEALSAARAERDRLNQKWREEQAAREQEAEKQRRIAGFVEYRRKSGKGDWWWKCEDSEYYLNEHGGAVPGKNKDTITVTRAELEAALRAAGVEEPLTDEQRTALEGWFRYYKNPNKWVIGPSHDVIYLRKDGTGWNPTPYYGNFGNDCDVRITKSQMENFKPMPIEEPVTISDELRALLETKISGVILREDLGGKTVYVGKDGFFYPVMPPYADVPTLPCTVDQRKAFLREKGIEVTP